jgi:hypothetical protein
MKKENMKTDKLKEGNVVDVVNDSDGEVIAQLVILEVQKSKLSSDLDTILYARWEKGYTGELAVEFRCEVMATENIRWKINVVETMKCRGLEEIDREKMIEKYFKELKIRTKQFRKEMK